jgi:hypothetical protein
MAFRSLFAKDENGRTIFNPAVMTDMGMPKPDEVYSVCGVWWALRNGVEFGPFVSAEAAKEAHGEQDE